MLWLCGFETLSLTLSARAETVPYELLLYDAHWGTQSLAQKVSLSEENIQTYPIRTRNATGVISAWLPWVILLRAMGPAHEPLRARNEYKRGLWQSKQRCHDFRLECCRFRNMPRGRTGYKIGKYLNRIVCYELVYKFTELRIKSPTSY